MTLILPRPQYCFQKRICKPLNAGSGYVYKVPCRKTYESILFLPAAFPLPDARTSAPRLQGWLRDRVYLSRWTADSLVSKPLLACSFAHLQPLVLLLGIAGVFSMAAVPRRSVSLQSPSLHLPYGLEPPDSNTDVSL